MHTSDDPADRIPHTAIQLVRRAAELEFDAIAITLHDLQIDSPALDRAARDMGLVLLPGVERTVEGRHVLLINFPADARAATAEQLADLKRQHPAGLVIAPHPFYPLPNCPRPLLARHADLFDAIEFNGCYASVLNFNKKAERWARQRGKPLVGCSDAHRLHLLGMTYSLVDAEGRDADAICAAVKRGAVQVRTRPLSATGLVTYLARMTLAGHRRAPADAHETLNAGHAE